MITSPTLCKVHKFIRQIVSPQAKIKKHDNKVSENCKRMLNKVNFAKKELNEDNSITTLNKVFTILNNLSESKLDSTIQGTKLSSITSPKIPSIDTIFNTFNIKCVINGNTTPLDFMSDSKVRRSQIKDWNQQGKIWFKVKTFDIDDFGIQNMYPATKQDALSIINIYSNYLKENIIK